MSSLLCPICGQRNDSTGHICWKPDAVILTDNSAVIRALEQRVEELEAENKQLLERESLCDWGWG